MHSDNRHSFSSPKHPFASGLTGWLWLNSLLAAPAMSATFDQPLAATVQPGRVLKSSDMTRLKPTLPRDIYRQQKPVDHRDLATFGWLNFIALSAPANRTHRGVAEGSFAGAATQRDALLVWQSYSHRSELHPANSAAKKPPLPPQPWNSQPQYRFSNHFSVDQVNLALFSQLDETQQSGQQLFYPRLRDNNNLSDWALLFETKVNHIHWQYVAENYQTLSSHNNHNHLQLPDNSLSVRATWRPLGSILDTQHHRYHISEAIYYRQDKDQLHAINGRFALTALDISYKTNHYPTRIFASFAHVDRFNDPYSQQSNGLYRLSDDHHAITVSPVMPHPAVSAVNQQALTAMQQIPGFSRHFIWQYYQLQGIQALPGNTDNDFNLSKLATPPGPSQPLSDPVSRRQNINMGGCQGCHGKAQQQGFGLSFLHPGYGGTGFNAAASQKTTIKPAPAAHSTIDWHKITNSAQYSANWQGLIARKKSMTLAQAKAYAAADNQIDFFFRVKGKGFRLSQHGRFEAGESVFFNGKPVLGKVQDTDVYIKP